MDAIFRGSLRISKNQLLKATELAFPNPEANFRLTTNASDFAVGAILEQSTLEEK